MQLTLKQARLVRGYTQEQMASVLGVHWQTYRKIELDPNSASIGQAKKISAALNIHYDDIFFGADSSLNRVEGQL